MSYTIKNSTTDNHYDLVIVGAGAVGITLLANILSQPTLKQLKIAIIDKQAITTHKKSNTVAKHRATALNFATKLIYQKIGIWHHFEKIATPIKQVIVKESFATPCNLKIGKDKLTDLGYVVAHNHLQNTLQQQLLQYVATKDVTLLDKNGVHSLTPTNNSMTLKLANNSIISAKLVVVADGGSSEIIANLGINKVTTDYQQTAIITNAQLAHPHNNIAYEYFTELGSIALLPQQKNHASIVWTINNTNLDYFQSFSKQHFLDILQHQFGAKNNIIFNDVSDRCYYPMKMSITSEQVRSNLVILGNAAHTIHPVAAQGYNLAAKCCALLVDNMLTSLQHSKEIGDLTRLLEYEKLAKQQQKPIIQGCDKIVKLFSHKSNNTKTIRNLGLFLFNKTFFTKRYFIRKAMGLTTEF